MAGLQVILFSVLVYYILMSEGFLYYIYVCIHVLITYLLVFSALGGSHGVPRVHYKGRQGDYYVMVSVGSFNFFTF